MQQKKLGNTYKFLQTESKTQLQVCQSELKKETNEVSRLWKELELAQTRNSKLERFVASEKKLREENVAKY